MRKKIVAGNWKMNLDFEAAKKLFDELIKLQSDKTEIVVCPPSIYLAYFSEKIQSNSNIKLGAQNCYSQDSGAFTGEISPLQLKSLKVDYCIVGHSERREHFNERYEDLTKKVKAILKNGLTPIFCCGEQFEVRKNNVYKEFIMKQIEDSLFQLSADEFGKIVIAYEPIWAIGTGKTATTEQAQEVHGLIRARVAKQYNEQTANNLRILYGGSCKPDNAKELFSQTDIDGGLIGGASLSSSDFNAIINSI